MKEDEKHVRSFQVKTGSRVLSRLDGEMVKWILCKLVLQSNLIGTDKQRKLQHFGMDTSSTCIHAKRDIIEK